MKIVPELQTCTETKKYPSQPTTVEEVKDEDFHGPDSHDCWDALQQDDHDIIGDMEFLVVLLVASEDWQ